MFINSNKGKERALKQIDFSDEIFKMMKKILLRVSEPHHVMSDATKQIKNKWQAYDVPRTCNCNSIETKDVTRDVPECKPLSRDVQWVRIKIKAKAETKLRNVIDNTQTRQNDNER